MAENEEVEETSSRRNEWEVVSLTASAYAASPDSEIAGIKGDEKGGMYSADETEISRALFMSGHFVFPPSQHENLPLEPETIEVLEDDRGKGDDSEIVLEGSTTIGKDGVDGGFGNSADVYSKLQLCDDDGCGSIDAEDFQENMNLQGLNPADNMHAHGGSSVSSVYSETSIVGSNPASELRKDIHCDSDIPSGAWWKKTAASLYAHAKEANTFWSVFVAAAVMGLVILGQSWQQERWKVLQLKWQMTVNDEKLGRMLAPIYRLKDAIVSSHRRGSLIRASSSREN